MLTVNWFWLPLEVCCKHVLLYILPGLGWHVYVSSGHGQKVVCSILAAGKLWAGVPCIVRMLKISGHPVPLSGIASIRKTPNCKWHGWPATGPSIVPVFEMLICNDFVNISLPYINKNILSLLRGDLRIGPAYPHARRKRWLKWGDFLE